MVQGMGLCFLEWVENENENEKDQCTYEEKHR